MKEIKGLYEIAEAYKSMKMAVRGNFVPVNESSLMHILGHKIRGYGIISACRSENDKRTNNELSDQLKKDIRSAGFGYIPVRGGFRERTDDGIVDVFEMSYLVPCHEMDGIDRPYEYLERTLIELGVKYGQEAVLLCPPNGTPRYVVTKEYDETDDEGNVIKTYKIGDISMEFGDKVKLNDLAQDYFTSLNTVSEYPKNPLGKNVRRFTFESAEFPGDSLSYQQGHIRHCKGEINRIAHK